MEAEANVDLRDDGSACVSSATQDIGEGAHTILSQMLSEKLDIPHERIEVVLGDTSLPSGPISAGSWATASAIPAVIDAIDKARQSIYLTRRKDPMAPSPARNRKRLFSQKAESFSKMSHQ